MGLFDRFRKKKIEQSPGGGQNRIQVGWTYPAPRTTQDFLNEFHQNPRLNSVALIASDIARAQFKLFDKKQYRLDKNNAQPVLDHPFLDMVDNPCPDMVGIDWHSLMYMVTVGKLVAGEAFLILERDKLNVPRQAYYVPAHWMLSLPTSDAPYYRLSPLGNATRKTIPVLPQDVIYFKAENVVDPYNRGRARTERIADELEADTYASKWAKNSFFNSARPEMIVSMPDATQESATRLQEAWDVKFGGFRNSSRTAITGSKLEITKLTESPKEMDFVESRRYLKGVTREEYGIPPEMFGDISNSNRSTIDASQYLYSQNVLTRELDRTEATFNQQLMPQYKDGVILKYDNVVPADIVLIGQTALSAMQAGAITVNEYRKAIGQGPTKDGDIYLRSFAMIAVPQGSGDKPIAPATPPVVTPPEPEEPEEPEDDKPEGEAKSCGCLPFSVKKSARDFSAIYKKIDDVAVSAEKPFRDAIVTMSKKQEADFNKAFKKAKKAGLSDSAALDSAIDKAFDNKATVEALSPAWVQAMNKGAGLAQSFINKSISFDLFNPAFLQWLQDYGLDKAEWINDTTKEALRKSMADGIQAGESITDLAARVSAQFDGLADWRAVMIARTEAIGSVNFGSFQTYATEGVQTLVWISGSEASGTRPAHAEVNGVEYNINEGIFVDGIKMKYPGDPDGGAANVVNCRCSVAAVV